MGAPLCAARVWTPLLVIMVFPVGCAHDCRGLHRCSAGHLSSGEPSGVDSLPIANQVLDCHRSCHMVRSAACALFHCEWQDLKHTIKCGEAACHVEAKLQHDGQPRNVHTDAFDSWQNISLRQPWCICTMRRFGLAGGVSCAMPWERKWRTRSLLPIIWTVTLRTLRGLDAVSDLTYSTYLYGEVRQTARIS